MAGFLGIVVLLAVFFISMTASYRKYPKLDTEEHVMYAGAVTAGAVVVVSVILGLMSLS